jgi:hypothetical protein
MEMMDKRQIAHDLTIVYLNNRYGPEVRGSIAYSEDGGAGDVQTMRMPGPTERRTKKIGTGEMRLRGLLEKKVRVDDGLKIDGIFEEVLQDYIAVYQRFYELIDRS